MRTQMTKWKGAIAIYIYLKKTNRRTSIILINSIYATAYSSLHHLMFAWSFSEHFSCSFIKWKWKEARAFSKKKKTRFIESSHCVKDGRLEWNEFLQKTNKFSRKVKGRDRTQFSLVIPRFDCRYFSVKRKEYETVW